jgi:hypothetical protein
VGLQKYLLIFLLSLLTLPIFAEDLSGFYQTTDKHTKLPTSMIAIYLYEGKYYGKIIATYKKGALDETLEHPRTKAVNLPGKPFYCGLDIVWACTPDGKGNCKGAVFDPRDGKKYNARIWKEHGNLILRGEVLVFGRNETLKPFPKERFNHQFQQPNLKKFIPVHCKAK